jgi:hypothetical protein
MTINSIIQIILSVFLIIIMALIGYSIYNNEYIKSVRFSSSNKKHTKIYKGVLDFAKSDEIGLETYNKFAPAYVDINPSINQNGGAEYSYNFWICFNRNENGVLTSMSSVPPNVAKYAYFILFYKGEKQTLPYKSFGYECENINGLNLLENRILIKNPLVKIRNDAQEIIIEYNNINYPESYNNGSDTLKCNLAQSSNKEEIEKLLNIRNRNKFGIKDIKYNEYGQSFNMVTIVFQENQKGRDSINVNNTNCRVFLNGALVADRLANINPIEENTIDSFKSRVMKSNLSKLYINPYKSNLGNTSATLKPESFLANDKITSISPLLMADLSYFNYALDNYEIGSLYRQGFNKYPAMLPILDTSSTSYNKGFNFDDSLPKMI